MTIQVLIATMNQTDHSLLEKMNIQSNAIVGNQCAYNSIECFVWKKNEICYLNFHEKGVGLNRNNALMRANCDICLFADDDMIYIDDYPQIINDTFLKYPEADVIIFNLLERTIKEQQRYVIKKPTKVRWHNFMRYGMVRIACRYNSLYENGIFFNQCFGGGCKYQCGEDSIFLSDCLKKGLKIYAVPITIAELTEERKSTWNEGYTEKFFHDQGKLYRAISRRYWRALCLQDAIRHQKNYKKKWRYTYKIMRDAVIKE